METRYVYGLIKDVVAAEKIHKLATRYGAGLKQTDRVETLDALIRAQEPKLLILDFEGCESESYEVLKILKTIDVPGIAVLGFVSQVKEHAVDEGRRAGCERVYLKTQFFKELGDIFMRYLG